MNRLNFVLPDFTRVTWSSQPARDLWAPRVSRIAQAWEQVEQHAVAAGVKRSCLQNVPPAQLPQATADAAKLGLIALPLAQVAAGGLYSATSRPAQDGQPWVYRVTYTTAAHAAQWQEAWARSDDTLIGWLLGYPACCQAFFRRWWVQERMVDLTWPAALGGEDVDPGDGVTLARGFAPEANILGRWLGVRLVSHMPCSFGCDESVKIGCAMWAAGNDAGFVDEMAWAKEALAWPTEWSALHGIAEVKTPIWKVLTRTDATASKYSVRFLGRGYPEAAPSGRVFPFQPRESVVPIVSLRRDPTEWTDNGFATRAAMEAAHAIVDRVGLPLHSSVLDLGCGNGRLARRLAGLGMAVGVDQKAPRSHVLDRFIQASINQVETWRDEDVDLTVLMPGRLIEDQSSAVREALHGRQVVVYAYGDWLTRYGSLENLTKAAGLPWEPLALASGDAAVAARIEVN